MEVFEAVARLQELPTLASSSRRKVTGLTLALSVLLALVFLPFTLLGYLFQFLAAVFKWPMKTLGRWMVIRAVRVWYIHKVGRVHPWFSARQREKEGLASHSRCIRVDVMGMGGMPVGVHVIPQLHDNYAYLLVNQIGYVWESGEARENGEAGANGETGHARLAYGCLIIDAGNGAEVKQAIEAINAVHYSDGVLRPEAILTTHHHWDHMGGNATLRNFFPSISTIVGGRRDRVLNANRFVGEADVLDLCSGLRIYCHSTPAHTMGSITYRLLTHDANDCLFTGDTFFVGGCGACFEGTAQMMQANFTRLYLSSTADTLLFPGHEYSETILQSLFPNRAAHLARANPSKMMRLSKQLATASHLRSLLHPAPTVPVRLSDELSYNPNFDPILNAVTILMAALIHLINSSAPTAFSPLASPPLHSPSIPHQLSQPSTSPTNHDSLPTHNLSRMAPKVAQADCGTYCLVEPPWIVSHTRADYNPCEDVADGHSGLPISEIPSSVSSIAQYLKALAVPVDCESDQLAISIQLLERCVINPMGTPYRGVEEGELAVFRSTLACLVAHGGGTLNDEYILFEYILAFVVKTLKPTLIQGNKLLGKRFRGISAEDGEDELDNLFPQLEYHSVTLGGSILSLSPETTACASVATHDFTKCPWCNAQSVYLEQDVTLVHKPRDALPRTHPRSVSVLDCVIERSSAIDPQTRPSATPVFTADDDQSVAPSSNYETVGASGCATRRQ